MLQSMCISKYFLAIYRLLRMIVVMWFLSSWACCVFFSIDYYYYKQGGTYYQNQQLWLNGSSVVNGMDLITTFPWYIWY